MGKDDIELPSEDMHDLICCVAETDGTSDGILLNTIKPVYRKG